MNHLKNRRYGISAFLGFIMLLAIQSCKESGSAESKPPTNTTGEINATNSRTQFAEVNGRKIAYRSVGNGDPIILCLRFRGNLDSWDPAFLDALAANYRVITFDYTGFGASTGHPPGDMLSFAKDVRDLAGALQLKKIIVGGWSFGGGVAQIVTTEFPELVSQTILIGTRPPGKFNHAPEEIFLATSAKPENDLQDEIILFFEPGSAISRAAAKASHERIAQRTIDKDPYIKQELWQYYQKGFMDYAADPYNARQKLMNTTTPVLVVSADHEVVFPPENWFELNRKLPTTQVIVIPQAGHGPQQQYPEMVAGYIHGFIENNKKIIPPNQ